MMTYQTRTTDHDRLIDIIERDDAEFGAWAIDWLGIDIGDQWPTLHDYKRQWLIDANAVTEVDAVVTCNDADKWDGARVDYGVGVPCYTLAIEAEGMDAIGVVGWHWVEYSDGKWKTLDDDGNSRGMPSVDGWSILDGDNVGSVHPIPCWRGSDGRWHTLDRDSLSRSIAYAADDADHCVPDADEDDDGNDGDDSDE